MAGEALAVEDDRQMESLKGIPGSQAAKGFETRNSQGSVMLKIAIASDHAGFAAKEMIKTHLDHKGYVVRDFGTDGNDPVDYPDYIYPAAISVAGGQSDLGIVIGGSGNGESMVANKVCGIRCALCWNVHSARLAKQHNNANMISIGARMVDKHDALNMVDAWLEATFEKGRHVRRIEKIESLCEHLKYEFKLMESAMK